MINKKYFSLLLFILYLFFGVTISYFFIIKIYLIAIGLMGLLLLVTIFFCKEMFKKIKAKSLLKILFWLTIITSFTGTAFLAVPFGSYHIFLFRLLLPIILLLILIQILLNKGQLIISCRKIKFYLLFLTIWFCYAVLTMAWAPFKNDILKELFFLFSGFSIILLMVLYLKKLRDLKILYILWVVLLVFLTGIGLWEMFTGNRLSSSGYFATEWANKAIWPTAVFHNTNDFASYLVLSIPFVWVLLRYGKRKLLKWLISIVLFVSILFLLNKASSQLNYLALGLEIIFIILCLLKIDKKIKILSIIGLITIFILIFYPQIYSGLFNFLREFTPYSIAHTSTTGMARLAVTKNCLGGLIDSCGFGVGAGNIPSYIEQFARYPIVSGILSPHNWWMEILANYGIFIFFGYLLFYFSLIYNFWKIWHRIYEGWDKMLCEAILIALVGFSISCLGPSSMMQLNYHWLIFGFGLSFLNYYRIKYSAIKNKNL